MEGKEEMKKEVMQKKTQKENEGRKGRRITKKRKIIEKMKNKNEK